jgi:two-component system, OmpR family, sensor histidine kinase KdpD
MALATLTAAFRLLLGVSNGTVVALSFLLVVLFVAAVTTLRVAVATSILAALTLNFVFLPPVGRLTLEDPENWVALFVFLVVGAVATRLSLRAREQTDEATARRDELGRLFDLSRDVLLTTDSRGALDVLARYVSRRFGLEYVAICLPEPQGWRLHESAAGVTVARGDLDLAIATARGALEFDAETRTYGGHRPATTMDGADVLLTPIRIGTRAIGLLATAGRPVEPGTLDAVAGLAAIAVERATLLEERQEAERSRHGAELKSALLSSLSHDLQTPLTAITVASENLRSSWSDEDQRREQLDIVTTEVAGLNRLFQNIVAMARIETGAVDAAREWVHTTDIVDAAVQQVEQSLRNHPLELLVNDDDVVQVDPHLTSSALAHLLENAGRYSPAGAPISVSAETGEAGLRISVRDRGQGIAPQDLEHLFERFYRGADARRHAFGTGMGLAITRGLLAAQDGRVWAENYPDGGAIFTMTIPTQPRIGAVPSSEST